MASKNLIFLLVLLASTDSFHFAARAPSRLYRAGNGAGRSLSPLSAAVDLSGFPLAVVSEIDAGPPLGVVLTEFQSTADDELTPLVVSDVSEGLNAARLGVREGDCVIGINGLSLLAPGIGFDIVMDAIRNEFEGESGKVKVTFFRGSEFGGVEGFDSLLASIMSGGEVEDLVEEVADVEATEGEVLNIFKDLNVEEEEEREVGVGELFGSLFKETAKAVGEGLKDDGGGKEKEKEKKKGGLFGMFSQETVQIEEDPNQYANKVDDVAREYEGPRDAPNSNALDLQD